MPYQLATGFSHLSFAREMAEWYRYEDLQALALELRLVNFSLSDARQTAIDNIRSLRVQHPASVRDRFPEDAIMVRADVRLRTLLTNLVSQLSYKDYQKDASRLFRDGSREDTRDQVVGSSANDATRAYYKNVAELSNFLANSREIYGRAEFETKYGTWVVQPAP